MSGSDRELELRGARGLRHGELLPREYQLALPQHVLETEGIVRAVPVRLRVPEQPILLVRVARGPRQWRLKMSASVQPDQWDHVRLEAGQRQ